jgi:hypothetical protein
MHPITLLARLSAQHYAEMGQKHTGVALVSADLYAGTCRNDQIEGAVNYLQTFTSTMHPPAAIQQLERRYPASEGTEHLALAQSR